MSFMDDLLKGTLKHLGDCSPDATGEKYEKNVGSKGCQHVGSVTIPAGATLTLEKGSKLVDNSGPSEVVILPETELTMLSDMEGRGGQYMLSTPFATNPTAGGTYKLMWGGMEYTSKAVDMPALIEGMPPCIVLGNVAITGEVEGVENPDPSAPYAMMIYKDGVMDGDLTAYAVMVSVGITPEPPTISIVQTEGAASGGGGGGGGASAMIVNIDPSTMTIDKPFSDVHAAVSTGEIVHFLLKDSSKTSWFYPSECTANEIVAFYIYFNDGGILQAGGLKISSDGKVAPIGS